MSALQHLVAVHDGTPSGLFLDLADIMAALPAAAADRAWRILQLEATLLDRPAIDVRAMLDFGHAPGDGYAASWAELGLLAANTLQINNGLIVSPNPHRTPPTAADDDLTILAACDVVIAPKDSTLWHLWLPDAWLPSVTAAFSDVRSVPPGDASLTA